MSYYVWGSNISYFDYLQARSFENSFKSTISKSTRSIIVSNEELRRQHIAGVESLSSGFEQLSFDVQELTATFQWGFGELLTAVGRVNDALTELTRIAKTPAQVWAYEQFETARDAFRQGLFHEALECLDRAINGYAGNTGHKLEYRFHYLLGTIRLGSFQNTPKDVVNLADAENAFLNAARYARSDHPKEAGHALLAAGWAAYCQGKMLEAAQHSKQTIALVPELGEGHFQLAKIQMHVGAPDSALLNLERAIELDRAYSIKAAGDDDFKRYEAEVHALIEALRQRTQQKAEALLVDTQRQAEETEEWHVEEFLLPKYVELGSAKSALQEASSAARRNTYFGYLDSVGLCMDARSQFQQASAQFRERLNADALRQIASLDQRISSVRNSMMSGGWTAVLYLGVLLFFCLGCQQCSRVSEANDKQRQVRLDTMSKGLQELRNRGYDPKTLSIQKADEILGDKRFEDPPPWDTGTSPSGTWFLYAVLGSALAVTIAMVGDGRRRSRTTAPIEQEKLRLQRIRAQLGYPT